MSAYLNALREEGTREDLLREVERQMETADAAYAKGFADARERAAKLAQQRVEWFRQFDQDNEEYYRARKAEAATMVVAIRALTPEPSR